MVKRAVTNVQRQLWPSLLLETPLSQYRALIVASFVTFRIIDCIARSLCSDTCGIRREPGKRRLNVCIGWLSIALQSTGTGLVLLSKLLYETCANIKKKRVDDDGYGTLEARNRLLGASLTRIGAPRYFQIASSKSVDGGYTRRMRLMGESVYSGRGDSEDRFFEFGELRSTGSVV